ncbi:MAG: hypothetical protein L3J32_12740, partial [Rhizobiaceae bacterium]|nr:hypothetical protein [Rhizobiaceae bacterium]
MADYYSILKKTISGLSDNSQTTRSVVYSKARSAIDRQLRAIDPMPSDEAIDRQMQMLEGAIEKLETEFGGPPAPQPDDEMQPAQTPQAPVSQPVSSTAAVTAGQANENSAGEAPPHATAPIAAAPVLHDPKGMEYSETALAAQPDTKIDSRSQSGSINKSGKSKGGFGSTLLMIVLALGVIGGGLYALWLNKDALMSMVDGIGAPPAIVDTANDAATSETDNAGNADTNQMTQATDEVRT